MCHYTVVFQWYTSNVHPDFHFSLRPSKTTLVCQLWLPCGPLIVSSRWLLCTFTYLLWFLHTTVRTAEPLPIFQCRLKAHLVRVEP